jgi:hypothetical protein
MDALVAWMRGPQTLGSAICRALVPRALLFACIATAILVGQAMAVRPTSAELDAKPTPAPIWTLAERAAEPDCVPLATWPEGKPAPSVVVSRAADAKVVRVGFDQAWAANHNATAADDLWVLAVCP